MDAVHALEDEMTATGKTDAGMSLRDAIEQVTASLDPPLTPRQKLFLQWHLETEFGGDYAVRRAMLGGLEPRIWCKGRFEPRVLPF